MFFKKNSVKLSIDEMQSEWTEEKSKSNQCLVLPSKQQQFSSVQLAHGFGRNSARRLFQTCRRTSHVVLTSSFCGCRPAQIPRCLHDITNTHSMMLWPGLCGGQTITSSTPCSSRWQTGRLFGLVVRLQNLIWSQSDASPLDGSLTLPHFFKSA